MNDIALLFTALNVVFFTGVLVGIHAEHHDEHGTLAQRRRAVRAEERLAALSHHEQHSAVVIQIPGRLTQERARLNARAAARLAAMNGAER